MAHGFQPFLMSVFPIHFNTGEFERKGLFQNCVDRVEPCRPNGWQQTSHRPADEGKEQDRGRQRPARQQNSNAEQQQQANRSPAADAAKSAQQSGLQQKQTPDITRLRPQRQKHTDLPCFFVRRGQHAA